MRQELAADVRPTILAVEQYAEHFQSEAEELCLGLGLKATPTSATVTVKGRTFGSSCHWERDINDYKGGLSLLEDQGRVQKRLSMHLPARPSGDERSLLQLWK